MQSGRGGGTQYRRGSREDSQRGGHGRGEREAPRKPRRAEPLCCGHLHWAQRPYAPLTCEDSRVQTWQRALTTSQLIREGEKPVALSVPSWAMSDLLWKCPQAQVPRGTSWDRCVSRSEWAHAGAVHSQEGQARKAFGDTAELRYGTQKNCVLLELS